jgi:hypothetical protein
LNTIVLFGLFVLVTGIIFGNQVFAEPLDTIKTFVSNYNGDVATVKITWNQDDKAKNYTIGCVSCNPNTVKFTSSDNITFNNVTAFPNGSFAMLYVITYDSQNEMISVKQLIINLNQ